MEGKLRYTTFKTDMGWIGLLGSTRGLLRTTLPQHSAREARQLLGDRLGQATPSSPLFGDLIEQFRTYLSGRKTTFPAELDLSEATPFQREVWKATRLIPYGETRSYTWLAEQIKKPRAVRAVGQALGRNPLPIIIPCHRVLAADGKLGGYSGGVEMKIHLLRLETVAST